MLLFKSFLAGFHPQGLKRYFANTTWVLTEKIFGIALALAVSIFLARYLGVEKFGMLQYAISFCGLFGLLTTIGLDTVLVRDLVRSPQDSGRLLGTVAGLRIIAALLVLVALAGTLALTDHSFTVAMMILIIGAAYLPLATSTIENFFQANVVARRSAIARVVGYCAGLILVMAGIMLDADVIWFAWQPLLESCVLAVGLWVGFKAFRSSVGAFRFDPGLALALLKEAWPLTLSLGLVSIYANVDKVMIGALLGDEATGLYAVASRLSTGWYFIPLAITNSLFPAIMNARQGSLEHYRRRLQNLYDLMVMLAVGIAIPVSVFSGWIMETLYGAQYLEARYLLATQIWLCVPMFLGVASGRWLIAEGLHMSYLARTIVGVCCNLILNYLLIPVYGPIGAVYATGLSQLIVLVAPCMPGLFSHGCDVRRLAKSLVLFSYWNKTCTYQRD